MITLSILVTSLAAVGFNGASNDPVNAPYDGTFHFATASLYAADEALATPIDEAEQPSSLVQEQAPVMQGETYYVAGGGDCCSYRTPGFYAGGEITALRPFVGDTCLDPPCLVESALVVPDRVLPELDTYVAPRLWLGYTSCSGLGCRVRWWRMDMNASEAFDKEFPSDSFAGVLNASLDVEAIDFEVTDTLVVGQKWDVLVSGGLRYADFNWAKTTDGIFTRFNEEYDGIIRNDIGFEGVGPTAAIQAHRPWFHRVGLFAAVRGSLMFGKVDSRALVDTVPPIFGENVDAQGVSGGMVRSIWEAQLGVDWTHELWRGTYLNTRVAGEAQYWDAMLAQNTDIGFVGMTFAVGLIR